MKRVFETARLQIREMSMEDLDFVAGMLGDSQVMRYYPKTYSRQESIEWIERQCWRYEEYGYGLWLATDKQNSRPIAQIGLVEHEVEGRLHTGLAYLVDLHHWRRGYAFEGARASLNYGFRELGKPRILCLVRPENEPSQGLVRKLGMHWQERALYAGYVHDVYYEEPEHFEKQQHLSSQES